MDMRPKTERSVAVLESCLCVEEHCLVEGYESPEMLVDPNDNTRWKHN